MIRKSKEVVVIAVAIAVAHGCALLDSSPTPLALAATDSGESFFQAQEQATAFVESWPERTRNALAESQVLRYQLAEFNRSAAIRLFEGASNDTNRGTERFAYSPFPSISCTLTSAAVSTSRAGSRQLTAHCYEDDRLIVTGWMNDEQGSFGFELRDRCVSNSPRYSLMPLGGTHFALIYEVETVITGGPIVMLCQ